MKSRTEPGQDHILGITPRILGVIFPVAMKKNPYNIIEMLRVDTIDMLKVLIYG